MSKQKTKDKIVYPESDGKPMCDNTLQYYWITVIQENLDKILPCFVAADLLWYPVEGEPKISAAPDVMVMFGRPKGHRGSYKQWEEGNIAPQVVFEILSPSNTKKEMAEKLLFYQKYNVQEYYLYYPQRNTLRGWQRLGEQLVDIVPMSNWTSPLLGIRFEQSDQELTLYHADGQRFLSFLELNQRYEDILLAESQANAQIQQANAQIQQANAQIERERQQRLLAEQHLEQERLRAEQLRAKLRALGIDPNT